MKRTTKLSGVDGDSKIEIIIRTKAKVGKLTKNESYHDHNKLVEGVHKAMSDNGCYSQEIKVS